MTNPRAELRAWLSRNGRKSTSDAAIDDHTPLIEEGILSSVQVPDLLLLIEDLRGRPVEIDELGPGAFHSVETITRRFFGDD